MVFRRLPVVEADEQIAGPNEVGVTLGCEDVGTWVFVFEVLVNRDERVWGARAGGTAVAVPPCAVLIGSVQAPASS